MLAEIEKNEALANAYSKYELVRAVFGLLQIRKKEREKAHQKVEITEMVDQIIIDLSEGKISVEEVSVILSEE